MVRHILADGTAVRSIEGRVIQPTGKGEAVYRLAAAFLESQRHSTAAAQRQGCGGDALDAGENE